MEIKHITENGQGIFKAIENGQEIGLLAYTQPDDNTISLDHTEVNYLHEGKGIGKKLLMEIVDFARQKNLKIFPNCSYAKRVFERTEEIQDVLYKS
jgi:predicted GNAT family acetyltransferase